MKKKLLAVLLGVSMTTSLLAGCGGSSGTSKTDTTVTTAVAEPTTVATAETTAAVTDEGKVINIYCWNEEFKSRYTDYYEKAGKLPAGYKVNFIITPSDNNAYQNALDEALLNQDSAAQDDKVDMFLVEADYILKYVNSEYTMSMDDLGIKDGDMSKQFQYTRDIAKDSTGLQKAISWQACPGLYIYRRSFAKQVLGSDDPETVQAAVSDWSKFGDTADKMKKSGYAMVSGFDDTYRTFSNNASAAWVDGTNIKIDPKINDWISQTKDFTDKGYNQKTTLWAPEWASGQGASGKVFGYFMPAWGVDFVMAKNSLDKAEDDGGKLEVGNGCFGDWGACVGPESYNWGGTWICAAKGTDDSKIVADIMKTICCDDTTMTNIVKNDNDFANNKTVMDTLAKSDYKSEFLGGQNPLPMYIESAGKIDMSKISPYDQGLNESLQTAMHDYYNGTVDLDTAWKNFYTSIGEKYPELTHE